MVFSAGDHSDSGVSGVHWRRRFGRSVSTGSPPTPDSNVVSRPKWNWGVFSVNINRLESSVSYLLFLVGNSYNKCFLHLRFILPIKLKCIYTYLCIYRKSNTDLKDVYVCVYEKFVKPMSFIIVVENEHTLETSVFWICLHVQILKISTCIHFVSYHINKCVN